MGEKSGNANGITFFQAVFRILSGGQTNKRRTVDNSDNVETDGRQIMQVTVFKKTNYSERH